MDPVYSVVFEVLMLVCFGLSWPFNIAKSWDSRTARGKSLIFEFCIVAGYCFGIAGKFISGNVNYILVVYILDVLMVCIDIILTIRNKALDHMADKRAEKARMEKEKIEKERLDKERLAAEKIKEEKELAE